MTQPQIKLGLNILTKMLIYRFTWSFNQERLVFLGLLLNKVVEVLSMTTSQMQALPIISISGEILN